MKAVQRWLPVVATLAVAYALKHHYSTATAEELRWILAPTAAATGLVLGQEFVWQAGAGYFSPDLSIVIAKACAGLNFLIVAFVALCLAFAPGFRTLAARFAWCAAALVVAYAAALVANTARIVLSVLLAHVAARWLELSFQAVHRALGVGIYLAALAGLLLACSRALGERAAHARPLAVGLAAYLGLTLVVPLLRGAGTRPEFVEHAAMVVGSAGALGLLALAIRALRRTRPRAQVA